MAGLDDGNPPPERKSWTEVSYDEETRTFRGAATCERRAALRRGKRGDGRCKVAIH